MRFTAQLPAGANLEQRVDGTWVGPLPNSFGALNTAPEEPELPESIDYLGASQFLFATAGTMSVRTPRRAWIVPPSRALWIPARTVHEIRIDSAGEMRSLYMERAAAAGMSSGVWSM